MYLVLSAFTSSPISLAATTKASANFTLTAKFIPIMMHVYLANHASRFQNFQAKHLKFIFVTNLKSLGNTRKENNTETLS